jgi:plasmid maintenance system antidote protein VapI
MVKESGFEVLTCASVAAKLGVNYRTVQRVIENRDVLSTEVARLAKMRGDKGVIRKARELGLLPS